MVNYYFITLIVLATFAIGYALGNTSSTKDISPIPEDQDILVITVSPTKSPSRGTIENNTRRTETIRRNLLEELREKNDYSDDYQVPENEEKYPTSVPLPSTNWPTFEPLPTSKPAPTLDTSMFDQWEEDRCRRETQEYMDCITSMNEYNNCIYEGGTWCPREYYVPCSRPNCY